MGDAARPAAAAVTLAAEPISVSRARTFIRYQVEALGLHDVANLAALAGSELATNALLHARSEFTVQVTRLPDGAARISVYDASTLLPNFQPTPPSAAIGKGLPLVAAVTDGFGAEPTDDTAPHGPGKEVWFEVGGPQPAAATIARYSTVDPAAASALSTAPVFSGVMVDVQLLNTPLQPFARELARHRELMREMALIAFAEKGRHYVPIAVTQLAAELESYRGVGAATDALRDAAIARGDLSIALVYRVPPAVGPACARLDELLDEAEIYCRNENLLTLAATPEGLAVRR